MKNQTTVERTSDRELVVTRTFNGPARIVFKAWTTPELFKQWWLPASFGISLISYEADFRTGGTYRLVLEGRGEGRVSLVLNGVPVKAVDRTRGFHGLVLAPGRNTLIVKGEDAPVDLATLRFSR